MHQTLMIVGLLLVAQFAYKWVDMHNRPNNDGDLGGAMFSMVGGIVGVVLVLIALIIR